jgi:hypothetical protein
MTQHNFYGGDFFGGMFFIGSASAGTARDHIPATFRVRARTRREIAEDRKKHGIPDAYLEVIKEVAAAQVSRLETDEQKRFEELHRELELRQIIWDGRYLEIMNQIREQMIAAEIAEHLRAHIQDEEELTMLTLLAAHL